MAKKPSAAQLAARKRFAEMARSGVWSRKKKAAAKKTTRKPNPLSKVKKTSPSMATGKAPSLRLRKRRQKTARAPAGFYANPVPKFSRMPVRYAVHQVTNGQPGALLGAFVAKADAQAFGRAWADKHKRQVMIVGKAR